MRANYNITNNRLFLWPDMPKGQRLPADQYEKVKAVHMQWWPRGCFTGLWNPEAEDLLIKLAGEITEDDTPDDIERRVDRYAGYAESAESQAEGAKDRILSGRAHTKRQLSQAESTAQSAAEKAEHWHSRIAGAIARAEHRDRPDVIVRRIEGLEKDQRYWQGYLELAKARFKGDPKIYYFAGKGRGAHQIDEERIPEVQARARRWLEHIEKRLEYEREYLEAVGGDPRKQVEDIHVGDTVIYNSEECEVLAVGKKNVRILIPSHHWSKSGMMVGREDLGEIVHRGSGKPKQAKVDDGIKRGVKVSFELGSQTYTGTVIKASPKNCLVSTENCGKWTQEAYPKGMPYRRSRLKIVEA